MACTQTLNGNVLGCREGNGGIKALYMANHSDVTVTRDQNADTITNIEATAGAVKVYELQEDNNSLTSSRQGDETSGSFFYQTDIVGVLGHMDATRRAEVKAVGKARLFAVAEYNSGVFVAVGVDRPAVASAVDIESGAALGDTDKVQITITGRDNEPPYVLSEAGITALRRATGEE